MTNDLAKFLKEASDTIGNQDSKIIGYSGRGMFGRQTTSLTCDSLPQLLLDVIQYIDARSQCCQALGLPEVDNIDGLSTDNLGYKTVIY